MKEYPFPWTDSGLELLEKIKSVIKDTGGRKVMYQVVTDELSQGKFWHGINRTDEVCKITAQHGIPYKQACNLIPMPYHQFIRKMAEYKRINRLKK